MTFEKAAKLLESKYEEAERTGYVQKPLAWALFQMWKEVDSAIEEGANCKHFKDKADIVEVKHGEWEMCADEYEICASEFVCSACKESFVSSEMTDEQFLEMMKYCPNCGARMDGGEEQ